MKRITLLRHAKSSWKDLGCADVDRPLSKRGKEDAPMMGGRLADRGFLPDLILSSPAKRAIRTAVAVARELAYPERKIKKKAAIYKAGVDELLRLVSGLGPEVEHVMLVGHNPGFTDFAAFLLSSEDIGNIPTCGVVDLEIDAVSWHGVTAGTGSLLIFDYPKKRPG